jgi:hypothetical protein
MEGKNPPANSKKKIQNGSQLFRNQVKKCLLFSLDPRRPKLISEVNSAFSNHQSAQLSAPEPVKQL